MDNNQKIEKLPKNFKEEEEQLISVGIKSWASLKKLKDTDLNNLVRVGRSTTHNLNLLRGMAQLICDLNISQKHAALLLHAGFPTVKSLAISNPQEILDRTGRLSRILNSELKTDIHLTKAKEWIQIAKDRQKQY